MNSRTARGTLASDGVGPGDAIDPHDRLQALQHAYPRMARVRRRSSRAGGRGVGSRSRRTRSSRCRSAGGRPFRSSCASTSRPTLVDDKNGQRQLRRRWIAPCRRCSPRHPDARPRARCSAKLQRRGSVARATPAAVAPRRIPVRAGAAPARHAVDARRAPRLAAHQTRERHPATGPQAVAVERLVGIFRAGRQMAAMEADERRERVVIGFDQAAAGEAREVEDTFTPPPWVSWPRSG